MVTGRTSKHIITHTTLKLDSTNIEAATGWGRPDHFSRERKSKESESEGRTLDLNREKRIDWAWKS